MTDPNRELLAQVARRPPPEPTRTLPDDDPPIFNQEWAVPIDITMADCNGARQVVLGQVAAAKADASRWDIGPMPVGWHE